MCVLLLSPVMSACTVVQATLITILYCTVLFCSVLCSTSGAHKYIAVSETSTSVLLNWTAPQPANGIIVYYTILINTTTTTSVVNTSSNATSFTLSGLMPCSWYTFAVCATTDCSGCTGPCLSALANVTTAANSTQSTHYCTLLYSNQSHWTVLTLHIVVRVQLVGILWFILRWRA